MHTKGPGCRLQTISSQGYVEGIHFPTPTIPVFVAVASWRSLCQNRVQLALESPGSAESLLLSLCMDVSIVWTETAVREFKGHTRVHRKDEEVMLLCFASLVMRGQG